MQIREADNLREWLSSRRADCEQRVNNSVGLVWVDMRRNHPTDLTSAYECARTFLSGDRNDLPRQIVTSDTDVIRVTVRIITNDAVTWNIIDVQPLRR